MKKQKTLFDSIEPKKKVKKKKKVKIKNQVKKERLSREKSEEQELEEKIKSQTKKVLKNEIYRCKCGLKINWKVAEARKECPQCNLPIKKSDLFDEIEI